jgi:hypothetical protein
MDETLSHEFKTNIPPTIDEIKEEEQKVLPEDPEKLTYRGRYDELDKNTLKLIQIETLPKNTPLDILDIGSGVLEFGAPTLHDLDDRIKKTGHKANITGIDPQMPESINPSHPDIKYYKSTSEVTGSFDIVRILRVAEHIETSAYEELKKYATDSLRDGGLLILTQYLGYMHFDKYYGDYSVKKLPPLTKIVQKRGNKLVTISLEADPKTPFNFNDFSNLDNYKNFRNKVASGQEKIIPELDVKGYNMSVGVLQKYPAECLDFEKVEQLKKADLLRTIKENEVSTNLNTISANAKDTSYYFSKSIKEEK